MFYLLGTVFQTAILVMFIIPRLRPGLLSLRSVLASSQNYPQSITNNRSPTTHNLQPTTDAISFGWKPIPSEARVTRDGVSGLEEK